MPDKFCPRCRGEGSLDAEFCMVTCWVCGGSGYVDGDE